MDEKEEAAAVQIGDGQGTQVGTGNTQYNAWAPKPPLDPTALGALNPHTAVARLQQLSHDELVDFFARASPRHVSSIVGVFLDIDHHKFIAILGDIGRRKATELIKGVGYLAKLPEAAETITREAAVRKLTNAELLEYLPEGYVRKYKNGRMVWSSVCGAHAIRGEIEKFWANNKDLLKFPKDDSATAPSSPFGTQGIRQPFEYVTVYSSKHGIYAVDQIVVECYVAAGGSAGWLGFPMSGYEAGSVGIQRFEGGAIHWRRKVGRRGGMSRAYAVRQEVVDAFPGVRDLSPESKEVATTSSFGTSGTVQSFRFNVNGNRRDTGVYSSESHGMAFVMPEIWNYYHGLSGESSWLGWPLARDLWSAVARRALWAEATGVAPEATDIDIWQQALPESDGFLSPEALLEQADTVTQDFEGGSIFWRPETGTVAVPEATVREILRDPAVPGKLGWPVSEERIIGPGESDRIQFFENGNVTLRGGEREIWLRLGM
jgi:hypothetical protein